MTWRRVVALLVLVFGFCLFAASQSFASQARIVRLSYINGKVEIERPGVEAEPAVLNMPVVQGTRVMAEPDSALEIEFENGNTLRAVGPATITFRELSLNGDGDKNTFVDLQAGTYFFDIKLKDNDEFRFTTLEHNLNLQKSARFRIIETPDNSRIAVYKGEIRLEGEPGDVRVKKNETLTFDRTDVGRYFLAKGIESDYNDAWDAERDQYRERYAKAESWKYVNNSYGSPYSYGFSDLNYYGNYFSVPGYGWMWRPAYYGADWDPFSNGAWSYYPGAGWTFVSMYPWGWAPYRYGQWIWVPRYGWCWSPGGHYNRWNAAPIIRNGPPNWRRPAPPPPTWRRTVLVNPSPRNEGGPGTWHRPGQANHVPLPRQSVAAPQGQQRVVGPSGRTVDGRENPNTGMRGGDPDAKPMPAPRPSTPENATGDSGSPGTRPPHVMDNRGGDSDARALPAPRPSTPENATGNSGSPRTRPPHVMDNRGGAGVSEKRDSGQSAGTWHRSAPEQPSDKAAPKPMAPPPSPSPRTVTPTPPPSNPAPRTAPPRGGSDFSSPRVSQPSSPRTSAPSSPGMERGASTGAGSAGASGRGK